MYLISKKLLKSIIKSSFNILTMDCHNLLTTFQVIPVFITEPICGTLAKGAFIAEYQAFLLFVSLKNTWMDILQHIH